MTVAHPIEGVGDTEVGRSCIVGSGCGRSHLPVTRYKEAGLRSKVRAHSGLTSKIGQQMLISIDTVSNVVVERIICSRRINLNPRDGPDIACHNVVLTLIALDAGVT